MKKQPSFLDPLHNQLDVVMPILWDGKGEIDTVLPFYIAFAAKMSKEPDSFYPQLMKCLEEIYGSDKTKRNKRDNEIAEYAYTLNAKSKDIFERIKDIK